ncbi:MAG: sigma-E processing peptidase SpoIIGA [Clostridiales bacterium]|nr:sigma-E processing peptidase SpoIIGA [Clostridiales bacterium]
MYIEFVIADNFLLTFLAGAAAARLSHKHVNIFRLLGASALGTVVAVFYPYMTVGLGLQIVIKVALGIALCAVMYVKTPRLITSSLLFFGCTFTFGGACYALWYSVGGTGAAAKYLGECPLFLTLGAGAVVFLGTEYVVKRLRLVRATAPYSYRAEVEIFKQKLTFDAFLDTGNCVFDERTGLPVVITDLELFTYKLDALSSVEFIKRADRFRKRRIVTAAGETEIFILRPERITVYSDKRKHKINAVLGLAAKGFTSRGHEMLLNSSALTEGV